MSRSPAPFEDRQIIHKDPHQLIEGMMICGLRDSGETGIYLHHGRSFSKGARILQRAIDLRRRKRDSAGKGILGSGYYSCDLVVHRGAGAYICGEETGLIESLEGKGRPNPMNQTTPYFPAGFGLCINARRSSIMSKPCAM